jgi:hypothetical protein
MAIALLILAGLLLSIALLDLKSSKSFREFQCNRCKHNFKVSYIRLLFTVKFRGTHPAHTGTAAYDLKCPNCNKRNWLIPLG